MEGEKEVWKLYMYSCTAYPIYPFFENTKYKFQESVRFSEMGARQLLQGE